MTPAASLVREEGAVLVDRDGRIRIAVDADDRPIHLVVRVVSRAVAVALLVAAVVAPAVDLAFDGVVEQCATEVGAGSEREGEPCARRVAP